MSTTSNTAKDLNDHLKFLTGQGNLSDDDATRIFKYAVDDYSQIAMESDGVQKFDDRSHTTYPVSTSTVDASNPKIELDKSFLQIDRVTVTVGGVERPLIAIDRRDYKDVTLLDQFGSSGVPSRYDIDANSLEVYPHPDASYVVTAYFTRAAKYFDVTDDSNEIGIPRIHHYYLILHSCRQLGFRTIDSNRVDIASELVKWEGTESAGRMTGGKIRSYYSKRDEDRPKRLRPHNLSRRTFNRETVNTDINRHII